mmetsp:Transcript_1557/g.3664  ORF Transcript_1557/g.3664 Transcript_1557/m.3664 type:complete len:201 (-) Transcript_1557:96-698(-)
MSGILAALPFDNLIGGPLSAAVHATNQASLTTIDFMKKVGFEPLRENDKTEPGVTPYGRVKNVEFKYEVVLPNGMPQKSKIVVPFLCMVPLPSLRVEMLEIDFVARLQTIKSTSLAIRSDLRRQTVGQESGATGEDDGSADAVFSTGVMTGTMSIQKGTQKGGSETRTYSMGIRVRATTGQLPGGLERLMAAMEEMVKAE